MNYLVAVIVYLVGVFTGAYTFNRKIREGTNSAVQSMLKWLSTHNTAYYERQAELKKKVGNEQKPK